MKITSKMIHRDIRLAGFFLKIFLKFKSKKSFVRMGRLMFLADRFAKVKGIQLSEQIISTIVNQNLKLCVYKPLNPKPDAIGLLWIHGGGYAIGSPKQDHAYIQNFINAANCIVVSPYYRLSPEAPYPAAVNDCYHALLWMKEHAADLGIRSDQLFVAGNSAGGGLSAAVTLMARDRKEVNIAFQMPFYPMIDDRMITPSSRDNNAPVWNSTANTIAWELYLGSLYCTDKVPVYAAPARETDFSGLPPAYSFVGDIEPFYDETRQYIQNLQNAGVNAELDIYPGCFHAFDHFCSGSKIGRTSREKYLEKFRYASTHYFAAQRNLSVPVKSNIAFSNSRSPRFVFSVTL